jgi:uncharacterized protein
VRLRACADATWRPASAAPEVEAVVFRPDRTAWLPSSNCLLVADVHLGKAARYRRLGVPVPEGSTQDSLARLSVALQQTRAVKLVVLGDLLHGPGCVTPPVQAAWQAFRSRHADLVIELVRGNHDRRAGDPPAEWGVQGVDEGQAGAWRLLHEPPDECGDGRVMRAKRVPCIRLQPWLAGHVHPAVILQGRAGDRVRLPCFLARNAGALLPAFGAFTGGHAVALRSGEQAWALGPHGLLEATPV